MSRTVRILPETNRTTLCVEVTGEVTGTDYAEIFEPPFRAIAAHDFLFDLFLIYSPDFTGWTPEAADLSFKALTSLAPKARKLAYVNAPDSKMLAMKILKGITGAEIRFFETDQADEALRWVKE